MKNKKTFLQHHAVHSSRGNFGLNLDDRDILEIYANDFQWNQI